MKPKMCEARCLLLNFKGKHSAGCLWNGKIRPQNVNGFETIFILAIFEFILTTATQIKRKNDDRGKDFLELKTWQLRSKSEI